MNTIKDLVNAFLLDCRANGLKPATVRWYQGRLGPLAAAMGEFTIEKVTRSIVRSYLASLSERSNRYEKAPQRPQIAGGLSKITLNGHRRAISTFFRWSYEELGLDPLYNPMRNTLRSGKKMFWEQDIEAKAIDPADYARLIAACGNDMRGLRDKVAITLLRDTGCRAGGLLTMNIDELDLERRRIHVIEKFDKSRTVFLSPQSCDLLRQWIAVRPKGAGTTLIVSVQNGHLGEPLTLSGLHILLRDLKKATGIEGRINPHSFRHRFAIDYLNNGGDVESLSQILGHSDTYVTMHYYGRYCNDELQRRFNKYGPLSRKSA